MRYVMLFTDTFHLQLLCHLCRPLLQFTQNKENNAETMKNGKLKLTNSFTGVYSIFSDCDRNMYGQH